MRPPVTGDVSGTNYDPGRRDANRPVDNSPTQLEDGGATQRCDNIALHGLPATIWWQANLKTASAS